MLRDSPGGCKAKFGSHYSTMVRRRTIYGLLTQPLLNQAIFLSFSVFFHAARTLDRKRSSCLLSLREYSSALRKIPTLAGKSQIRPHACCRILSQ
ncbi:hypothetical protein BDW60DRAFT_189553 [Aspergillus nidulans var. acristatus]